MEYLICCRDLKFLLNVKWQRNTEEPEHTDEVFYVCER